MECKQVQRRLTAWSDHEIPGDDAVALEVHLGACPACRARAESLKALIRALDGLGAVSAPEGFSRHVCRAARAGMESVDMAQWWHHLSLTWRGMVCGMAMAGLLFGAVLGTSLGTSSENTASSALYLALSDDGGYY
ncbi:anti-sigma factor family protein [Desulfobacter sp.]|uniref:anti-sigma factor family protein n=1 Tax=Desulfobacter sp. TaxID=2294 RepID=UPI003D0FA3DA